MPAKKGKDKKKKEETAIAVKEETSALVKPLSQVLTKEQKELIKRCFAKNATDDELDLYYNFCEKAGVDPLRGQSHFIKYKPTDKPIMMIGIDGFQARATSDPRYIGMVANAVGENDDFKMNPPMGEVEHSFGIKDRGKIVGAYAILKRTGMETAVIWVQFDEYYRKSYGGKQNIWDDKSEVMIVKVAKASLLRREYPDNFSGVYVPEEFDAEITEKGDFIDHSKGKAEPFPEGQSTRTPPKEDIQDADFQEIPEEEPEDDSNDKVRDIPDDLINDTMKPREAMKEIMNYAFVQEIGDAIRPVITKHYEEWGTGKPYAYNIPEPALIKIIEELTGQKLKKAEKSKKCSSCNSKITEPEAEEQQNDDEKPLCLACYKTFQDQQESEE